MKITKHQKSKNKTRWQDFLKKHRLSPSGIPCFAMILGVFKAVARAHTWSYVTADTAAESTKTSEAVQGEAAAGFFSKSAQKANAKRSRND